MKKLAIEICCYSLTSARTAELGGASRIELCGGLFEGGTTPSQGLMQQVRQGLRIPVYAMIRPRGGDFLYSSDELAVMESDVAAAKAAGMNGVVFGFLSPDGRVDEALTTHFVKLAKPLGVTFHRAFDVTPDAADALEAVIASGCERILTSAHRQKAAENLPLLQQLVQQAAGRIEIMAGSGVGATNAPALAATGVDALHLSAKEALQSDMIYRPNHVRMASELATSEYVRYEANLTEIQQVIQLTS